uniref:Collagen alpha-1(VII) chain n=1 Tax=Neogobius melanostomus TaxID=47308 RepID=A0A8C6UMM6_9GOBI
MLVFLPACRTVVQADIVFLVDESRSVGQSSFSRVKDFVSSVVTYFPENVVGPEGVRFGVTVFGDIPRMHIALTDYSSQEEVLKAIRELTYEGGSRQTGSALTFLVENVFSAAISRDHAPKIAVLITNGRSDDQVESAARGVADNGISLFAVGVKGADEAELRRVVSEPRDEHLLFEADFSLLEAVLPRLSRRVCLTASEPPRPVKLPVVGPRDLQIREVSHNSFTLTWTPATGDVTGYRLLVTSLNSKGQPIHSQQRQIDLKADVSTVLVTDLTPKTDYSLTVYAIYPSLIGDSVTIPVQTVKLVPVKQFLVQNATTDTLQAKWTSVKGASGYRLTWEAPDGHIENVNLGDNFNFYMMQGLRPGAEYSFNINPIFGDIEGPVTTNKAKTLESSAVQTLKVSAVTTSSAVISWNSVPGATGYRLAWGPTPEFTGRDRPRQLALNGSTTEYHLKNVAHDTEYVLSLYVLFGSVVGPGISATFRTSPLGYVSNFKVTSYTSSSIDVKWSPIVGATEYRLTWKTGNILQSKYLDHNLLFYRIEDLKPLATYTITICALYGNTEGPEISLSQHTVEFEPYSFLLLSPAVAPKPFMYRFSCFVAALSDSDTIRAPRDVKVVDIGVNFFTLTWKKTSGASGYKISWTPFLGGEDKSHTVSGASTLYTIRNLRESSAYKIQLSLVVGSKEGSPVLVTARTLDLPKVNGFAALNTTDSSTVLNWTRVPEVSGYLLSWRHISVLDTKTEILGPGFTSFKIGDLLYGRTYIFAIRPLYGEVEGPITTIYQKIRKTHPSFSFLHTHQNYYILNNLILLLFSFSVGEDPPVESVPPVPATAALRVTAAPLPAVPLTTSRRTGSEWDSNHRLAGYRTPAVPPELTCLFDFSDTSDVCLLNVLCSDIVPCVSVGCDKAKADVVFLVDESSSIGVDNFKRIKDFIFRAVTYFPFIGPQGTQIAVVHYSDDPRIEFRLNDNKDRNALLRALRALPYRGGNTKTGKGIGYVLQELFHESLGMRRDAPHVLVLITDGRAQDDVLPPSRVARALGVSVLAVGVANADIDELNKIAAPTNYKNIFYSPSFDDFPSIERDFISSICSEELLSEYKPEGSSGTDGIPGLPGRPGRSGPPGSAGQRVKTQRTVHVLLLPFIGLLIPGFGIPGQRGPKGENGERGNVGLSGKPGPKGALGVKGDQGLKVQCLYLKVFATFLSCISLLILFVPQTYLSQGDIGPSGEPGDRGIRGPLGLPGRPGDQGEKGDSGSGLPVIRTSLGSNLFDGFLMSFSSQGEPGEPGPPGAQGIQGIRGNAGGQGFPGLKGPPGDPGEPGREGDRGKRGKNGSPGTQGPKGTPGTQGTSGIPGAKGDKNIYYNVNYSMCSGERGPPGFDGDKGEKGEDGPPGSKGLKGDAGKKGAIGRFGARGPVGQKGDTGEPGLNGVMGRNGDDGIDGAKGDKGDTGLHGEKGSQGDAGEPGLPGDNGEKGEKVHYIQCQCFRSEVLNWWVGTNGHRLLCFLTTTLEAAIALHCPPLPTIAVILPSSGSKIS